MELKIIKKVSEKKKNGSDKKIYYIQFNNGEKIVTDEKHKGGEICFTEMRNGKIKLINYYVYKDLITYLENDNKDKINKSLLINKFSNIFSLKLNKKNASENEHKILKNIAVDNKFVKNNLKDIFDWINFDGLISEKLVIGLGNPSIFETDIMLHNIYGVPYIPGSAIKGVFRNYFINEYFIKKHNDLIPSELDKVIKTNSIFLDIFGGENIENKKFKGKVIFMDSFPKEDFKLSIDIMTSHHQEYYTKDNNKSFPLDSDKTNPINFLVVEDTKFNFNIGIDNNIAYKKLKEYNNDSNLFDNYDLDMNIKEFISDNLKECLKFHGIGAKTSVGYGYFNIDKEK